MLYQAWSSLRQMREARGLTLADAEKATRVRSRYLRALEEGRLEELPGGSYPRVFLRDYASYLGLDPETLLADLPEPEPEISPRPAPPPLKPLPWRAALLAGAVLTVLALGAFWALGSRHHAQPPLAPAPARAAAPKPRAAAATAKRHAAVATAAVLRAARGNCWILVKQGDRVVWRGMLRQGQTLRLGLARPLSLRLGAPWNLDVSAPGRVPALPHHVVDATLSRAGLATA